MNNWVCRFFICHPVFRKRMMKYVWMQILICTTRHPSKVQTNYNKCKVHWIFLFLLKVYLRQFLISNRQNKNLSINCIFYSMKTVFILMRFSCRTSWPKRVRRCFKRKEHFYRVCRDLWKMICSGRIHLPGVWGESWCIKQCYLLS